MLKKNKNACKKVFATILCLFSLTGCALSANIQAIKTAGLGKYKVTEVGKNAYSVSGKGITFDVVKSVNGYTNNFESNLLEFYLMEYKEAGNEFPLEAVEYTEDGIQQLELELRYSTLDELEEKEENLKDFISFSNKTFAAKITYIYNTNVDDDIINKFVETKNEFEIYKRDLKEVKQTFADAEYFLENGSYLNEVSYGGLYNLLLQNNFEVEGNCYHFKYSFNGDTYEFGYDLGLNYLKNNNAVSCRKKLNYFNIGEVSGISKESN